MPNLEDDLLVDTLVDAILARLQESQPAGPQRLSEAVGGTVIKCHPRRARLGNLVLRVVDGPSAGELAGSLVLREVESAGRITGP